MLTDSGKERRAALLVIYPEVLDWDVERLKRELKEVQAFISNENNSIGRQDFYWEEVLILELEYRNK